MRKLLILAMLCPYFSMCQPLSINGKIINENMEPVAGATVVLKRTGQATISDVSGGFYLTNLQLHDTLLITAVGYAPAKEVLQFTSRDRLTVVLTRKTADLDGVIVMAYGTTTRRFNTGSISRISSEEISRQPLTNPVAALQGLAPGLLVNQRNGLPGSLINVNIRGIATLKQGTQPLFVVDGTPMMLNTGSIAQFTPDIHSIFNLLNPADIQSIEILKDADATAIYGSQGANGVVLITTKKPKQGTTVQLNYYTSWGRPTRLLPLMETADYRKMRRQAYVNDGTTPSFATAPDLLVWDSLQYTNWQKELLGGKARVNNYQASLNSGNGNAGIILSINRSEQSTVFPESSPAIRNSARLNTTTNIGNRLRLALNTVYSQDKRDKPFADLISFTFLPPNAPQPLDADGNLVWTAGIDNPYAYLQEKYYSLNENLLTNFNLRLRVLSNLLFIADLGYNTISLNEKQQSPIAARRPAPNNTATLQISGSSLKSWIVEPRLSWTPSIANASWEMLAGLSLQERKQDQNTTTGYGIPSDDLIDNIATAGNIYVSNSFTQYNYAAGFARIKGIIREKYLVNFNLRHDGSSRFAPAARWMTFGALGGGWIFSEEALLKNNLPFLSFGKLRASYGITGNDQIGDYQFHDAWSSFATYQYGGNAGISPTKLFNPLYQWEKNKKFEAAIELMFFKQAVSLTASYFRTKSDNLLTNQRLPTQTGFANILKNIDAEVQNTGWEFDLTVKPVQSSSLHWSATALLTIPRNKLLRYPGLESSSDRFQYAEGMPVTLYRSFTYQGIDPQTGIYQFDDVDGDGRISSPNDLNFVTGLSPRFYASINHNLGWRHWSLSLTIYGISQPGRNYLLNITSPPGSMYNQPDFTKTSWQNSGDNMPFQRYTATASNPAFGAYTQFRNSSAQITDASFIRLRNISVSYAFQNKSSWGRPTIFVAGQNLLTFSGYKGADPETQSALAMPPLKQIAAGINFTF